MKTKLLFLHALSPLHAGTGQGVGVIDLPIAREKGTGIPIVPGSSIKGVLRANCSEDDTKTRVFGPDTSNASDHGGSVQLSDLRLLFLPVRSLAGTFAWVTSPLLLRRFQRDAVLASSGFAAAIPPIPREDVCLVARRDAGLVFKQKEVDEVVLEDLKLTPQPSDDIKTWAAVLAPQIFGGDMAWADLFTKRICVVHDDVLSFLLETATEVTARIQLDKDKKTVKHGALWYEEALPTESILAGIMVVQPIMANEAEVFGIIQALTNNPLQVGGSVTVGRGLCRIHMV